MIIDVHHHWIPREYVETIEKYLLPGQRVEWKGEEGAVKEGEYDLFNPGRRFYSTEDQIRHLEEAGIDMAVLSMGCFQDWTTTAMAPGINNAMAEIQRKYPNRIIGLAHVATLEDSAPKELERCVKELGLKGVSFNTNTRGLYPDAKEFGPLYRKVVELDVPIVIHAASMPYTAYMRQVTKQGIPSPLLARATDHMIASARVTSTGVLDEFPGLKFVFGHLGGAGFFTSLSRFGLKPGTPAYKKMQTHCYFDTAPVGWGKSVLNCAISGYGVDNVLLGSDYPAATTNDAAGLKKAVQAIEELELPQKQKKKILGNTARELFKV